MPVKKFNKRLLKFVFITETFLAVSLLTACGDTNTPTSPLLSPIATATAALVPATAAEVSVAAYATVTSAPSAAPTSTSSNSTTKAATPSAAATQKLATTAAASPAVKSSSSPGGTATPAVAAIETLIVPDGYTLYSDKENLNFELAYPSTWKPEPGKYDAYYDVTFKGPTGLQMRVIREKNNSYSTIDQYNAAIIDSLKKQNYIFRDTNGSRFADFGGEKWLQSYFTSASQRVVSFVALHRGGAYAMELRGPSAEFGSTIKPEFVQMQKTLHFLDAPQISYAAYNVASYNDPKGKYIFNYPSSGWQEKGGVISNIKEPTLKMYMLDVTSRSFSANALLDEYKDKLANSSQDYQNFKEETRYAVVKLDNQNESAYFTFTFTRNRTDLAGRLVVRKSGNLTFVGVIEAPDATEANIMYFSYWIYTEFLT